MPIRTSSIGLAAAAVFALVTVPAAAAESVPVTGDRIEVTQLPDGSASYGIRPGPGREHMEFAALQHGGRHLVLPADAIPLLAMGKLDKSAFSVGDRVTPAISRQLAKLRTNVIDRQGNPASLAIGVAINIATGDGEFLDIGVTKLGVVVGEAGGESTVDARPARRFGYGWINQGRR
jgi:hypothetical protein